MKNLLAYAYLMTNFDAGGRTPLQVLERVVMRSLLSSPERQTLTSLRSAIEKDWGIAIPIKVVRYTMGRLSAQSRVQWQYDEGRLEETYSVKMSESEKLKIKKQEQLARGKYERFRKKVTASIFREGLHAKYQADEVIEGWLDKSALSFLGNSLATKIPSATDFTTNRIIAKTLGIAGEEDQEAISDLADLALGDALYRSLKEITELDVDEDRITAQVAYTSKTVQVFLDVGILARALGYYGEEQQIAMDEMLKMTREVGYLPCSFEHTVDELQAIVSGASFHLQSGSSTIHRPMVKYAIRMGVSATEMLAQSRRIRDICQDAGILIIPSPPHDIPLTLDEKELERRILIGVQQENPRARERDIDSLTSIFRLRDGEARETLDSCGAIFITHNRTLQDVAHKFFRSHFDAEKVKNIVQICMTDTVFSSRLWTKLPTTVNWRPRNQVIAFALSNLAPAQGIREAFLHQLRELVARETINPETAAFVELSDFTTELLALEYRYGDHFDHEEAETVVRKVIEKARADLRTARESGLEQGITRTEAYYDRILKERETLAARFSEDTEAQIEDLRGAIAQSKAELALFRGVARSVARGTVQCLLFLVILGIAVTGLIAAGAIPDGLMAAFISTVPSGVLAWITWRGLSHSSLAELMQRAIEERLIRWSGARAKEVSLPADKP